MTVVPRRPVLLAICALLIGAPTAAQSNADAEQIRLLRAQSNDAIARHDVQAILSFLDDEFQVTAGSGTMIRSGAEMGDLLTQQFEEYEDLVYVRTIESVEISASGPLASEIGTWVGTWVSPDGSTRSVGRYSASWRKSEGVWRIRAELFVTLSCEGAGCS